MLPWELSNAIDVVRLALPEPGLAEPVLKFGMPPLHS